MIGPERVCKNCGHRCHCYSPNCPNCINDVCVTCNCEEENYAAVAESLKGFRCTRLCGPHGQMEKRRHVNDGQDRERCGTYIFYEEEVQRKVHPERSQPWHSGWTRAREPWVPQARGAPPHRTNAGEH